MVNLNLNFIEAIKNNVKTKGQGLVCWREIWYDINEVVVYAKTSPCPRVCIFIVVLHQRAQNVLTISSIVILNALGFLDRVKEISDRLFVTPSIKLFVRKGISNAIKYDAVVSTAFLDENNKFRMKESTEDTKIFKRTFWTQVLTAINGFNEIKTVVLNTSIYDKIHNFVDISEFKSINISAEESAY